LEEAERRWSQREGQLGLPRETPPHLESEVGRLLSLSPSALHKMSAEECGEGAFMLSQMAFHLQRVMNGEQARATGAALSVKKRVSSIVSKVPGFSYEERLYAAIEEDEGARPLEAVRVNSLLVVERLRDLSYRVNEMGRALLSLQASKRGKHE
jgi:hypothetical protein